MGRGTLGEVRDRSVKPRVGPGWVKKPTVRTGTGRWTTLEVRDGLGDTPGGSRRVGGPTGRSETVRGDNRGCPGQVEQPSRRSGTVQGTLPNV